MGIDEALDLATDDQIWEALKKRNPCLILVTCRPDKDKNIPDNIKVAYAGSLAQCVGLATVARKLCEKELMSTFEEDGDGE